MCIRDRLCDTDCEVLEANSRNIQPRIETTNANAQALADFLRSQPAVADVCYPDQCQNFAAIKTENGGFGGLLSIVLNDPGNTTQPFFDRLQVCKGPNLGTYFTLACPFTILAHYDELNWAESSGVSRWLVRISVGTEPIDELKQRFAAALT